ncbi:MAG: ComF family protein [Gammaproteobacteria bacterium]|nr:ComF family protein [Gammaproteobacteria bacterium]MBU1654187.1 ComF family protein [Gammaproteobacteria bacterium]MBU1959661.1 ComF family protein [Gammaproteobacteria bacterium]
MVNRWLNIIQMRLFPSSCLLCGSPGVRGMDLCGECKRDLPYIESRCSRCSIPLPQDGVCGQCQKSPPRFDRCFSPFSYEGLVADLVTDLKFRSRLQAGRLLAELLFEQIRQSELDLPQILIPVPLHNARLRERGYNQALELARPLASRLRLAVSYRSCVRLRATGPQSSLPRKERAKNIKGAFALKIPIQERHVALVDDVVTTGSTVDELAKLLKASGVERVDVWCVARTAGG